VRGREIEGAAGMVAVLVGDQDARQIGGREPKAREPLFGIAQVEAAIDQQPRGAGLGDQAVAAAAAG
jgi:hypothetical protein